MEMENDMHPQRLGEHRETRVLDITFKMMIVIMKRYKTFQGSIPPYSDMDAVVITNGTLHFKEVWWMEYFLRN